MRGPSSRQTASANSLTASFPSLSVTCRPKKPREPASSPRAGVISGARPLSTSTTPPSGTPRSSRAADSAGPVDRWSCDENWRVQTITSILASHRGCVHHFRIAHTRFRGRKSLVDGWLRILARKSVQEIVLHFPDPSPFNEREIPASLLACESLTTLHLMNCLLRRIHVRSRSLRTLRVGSSQLFIDDAPNLERLLGYLFAYGGWLKVASTPKLEILDYLTTQIDRLDLGNNVFKISLDRTEVSLSTLVHSLKTFAIEVNFHCCEQTKMLAGLLRCLPRLETLQIVCGFANSANHEVSDYWESLDPIDCVDLQLKTVTFEMYGGLVGELNFARFLVTKARVLKVMKFESRTGCSKRWVRKQEKFLRLQGRASLDAQITFTKITSRNDGTSGRWKRRILKLMGVCFGATLKSLGQLKNLPRKGKRWREKSRGVELPEGQERRG
ncbi:hypothetical protein ACMD2_03878 [Ananas comosus]|uniref:Uncharacterized protein n=1 Tax=Ananas comosus TaxID=4615 RepID=A0A199W590_ANACO|nr:hypothetical protein ACMD2_03878 [Ananas comosus]